MFVGHFGMALAAKRLEPRASLAVLILAAQRGTTEVNFQTPSITWPLVASGQGVHRHPDWQR